jgi:hypothetical protein
MDIETFSRWLDAYGRAWEARDPEAAQCLFTEDAVYHWTPFDEPKRGRRAIADAWRAATARQADVHFEHEILVVTSGSGIARWRTSFLRLATGRRIRLDGILVASLGPGDLCSHFREWWHSTEAEARG